MFLALFNNSVQEVCAARRYLKVLAGAECSLNLYIIEQSNANVGTIMVDLGLQSSDEIVIFSVLPVLFIRRNLLLSSA